VKKVQIILSQGKKKKEDEVDDEDVDLVRTSVTRQSASNDTTILSIQ
jgi:hypothetical protein